MTPQALAAPPVRTVRAWPPSWIPPRRAPAGYLGGSLRQPVLLLLIASSALGFRFGARR